MSVWPLLMGFSAYLLIAGALVGNGLARNVGGAVFLAYVLMQLKKLGFDYPYSHAVSALIWMAAASFIASLAFYSRDGYGIPLTYVAIAFLLALSGSCYFWARLIGAKSGFMVPHAATADLLAIAAMLVAGRGLGGRVFSKIHRMFDVVASGGAGG